MSFSISMMQNSSPLIKVDKTVATIATVTGNLREGTSVTDPIIEIAYTLPNNIISSVNYAHIPDWHRYYYVSNIELDITGLWLITMHVDVLMSYKDSIRQQNAIIARQERKRNMYLDDGWFMAYQNPIIEDHYFSVSNPFEAEEYVLVLAGS